MLVIKENQTYIKVLARLEAEPKNTEVWMHKVDKKATHTVTRHFAR